MAFVLAITPIILILFLMVGLQWGAARAGSAGYLCALGIAILFFGARLPLLAYAHTKALLLALDVLLIIWSAFLLFRVADEAGAIRTIGMALPHLTNDKGMQALIIGWVFASFLQGVGGFGVPVAVIAPILVGLGFTPLSAVVIPSIGHGWAVTFGSLGSSFQALMASTGLSAEILSPYPALFLGISGLMVGFMVTHAATGWAGITRLALPVIFFGIVMGGIQYLVVAAGLWNIGAFAGGLAGLLIVLPLASRYRGESGSVSSRTLDVKALLIALSGYLGLIVIILVVQFTPAIKDFLGQVIITIQFPEISISGGLLNRPVFITPGGAGRNINVFRHTGALLAYGSILAYLIYWKAGLYQPRALQRILGGTIRRVLSSSVSIVSMVSMAVVMEHAGMTDTLAQGLADGMGRLFPVVAPWIGALGAFMTGSNTNSNVVFGALQLKTATLLGFSVAVILAGQTSGAALASVLAPTKVVVGASTAGMAGKEGEVMRGMFVYTGSLVLLVSLLTLLGVWMAGRV
jgi:lactate permease